MSRFSLSDTLRDASIRVIVDDGDVDDPSSLADFFEANSAEDGGMDAEEVAAIRALDVGEVYRGGGGAWAEWSLRRVA